MYKLVFQVLNIGLKVNTLLSQIQSFNILLLFVFCKQFRFFDPPCILPKMQHRKIDCLQGTAHHTFTHYMVRI